MNSIVRGLAVGIVLAGASVGMAGVAAADPTPGPYTATIIDPGASNKKGSVIWSLEDCGPDCVRLLNTQAQPMSDLRRQGDVWTGISMTGDGTSFALDNASLLLTLQKPGLPNVVIGMTKNG